MFVRNWKDVPAESVGDGAVDTTIRWLVADRDGAQNFYMRMLEIGPGGRTPDHTHEWEHEVYFIEGTGELAGAGETLAFEAGDCALVPGGEQHFFRNTGGTTLRMLCLIPAPRDVEDE